MDEQDEDTATQSVEAAEAFGTVAKIISLTATVPGILFNENCIYKNTRQLIDLPVPLDGSLPYIGVEKDLPPANQVVFKGAEPGNYGSRASLVERYPGLLGNSGVLSDMCLDPEDRQLLVVGCGREQQIGGMNNVGKAIMQYTAGRKLTAVVLYHTEEKNGRLKVLLPPEVLRHTHAFRVPSNDAPQEDWDASLTDRLLHKHLRLTNRQQLHNEIKDFGIIFHHKLTINSVLEYLRRFRR